MSNESMKNLDIISADFIKKDESLFKALLKDKVALVMLIILLLMYLTSFFAEFITPYTNNFSNRNLTYSPPTKVYMFDQNLNISWPYVYNSTRYFNPDTFQQEYTQNKSKKYYLKLFPASDNYNLLGFIPMNFKLFGVENGGNIFLLGTDIGGRDVFSRLFYGGRISLTIGFIALFIAFPVGLLYGGISGYYGGWLDNVLMRIAEAIISIPSFYLLVSLSVLLPDKLSPVLRFASIIFILSFISWAGIARVVRGMVLSIKSQEFVEASVAIGASSFRTIVKHILPQTSSYVVIAITLSIPGYILAESSLSFLGLGIQKPDASWGNMLKEAQDYTNVIVRPWLLMPGGLIFLAILCFNLIGDSVRDYLDPKSRKRF